MRAPLLCLVAVAALVLNPFFACSADPAFRYGLPEIEAALAGTWHAKLTKDGTTRTATFRIEAARVAGAQQHGGRHLVRPAAACGQRTLVKSAAACLDETTVPLVLIALDGSAPAMIGTFRVIGTHFEQGSALLELGDVRISAVVARNGDVGDVRAMHENTAVELLHTK